MIQGRIKPKRSKALLVLMLPILVFIFVVGWAMYWIGDQPAPKKATRFEPVVLEAKNS